MNTLRQELANYLSLRRSLGYRLQRTEKLLNQFLDYLDQNDASRVTSELALEWAQLPSAADPVWWAARLGVAGIREVPARPR